MKPEKVFKRYDIRGDYPEEIDEKFAERLGKALGTFASRNYSNEVVVGRDTKSSSENLKQAFIDGLDLAGINVLDAGKGPTDYVAFTGMKNDAVSVQVTSSHLPLDTNGFKFMYPEGNGFLNPDLYEVQDLFRDQEFEKGEGGYSDVSENSRKDYRSEIKEFFRRYHSSIDRKVVVDTLGGASRGYLSGLMEELGAEVIDIAEERGSEEPYLDPPNPKPEKLTYLEERVEEEDAEMAVANDMDADRVAVYFNGEWISGNRLFAALADEISDGADVVASIDTSEMLGEVVEEKGGEVHYTRVGDPFVIDRVLETDAELAGEPNDHYCFPGFVPYNSGILAALFFSAMEIEQVLGDLPEYFTDRLNVELESNEEKEERMEELEGTISERFKVVSDLDGIKYRQDGATVLVRPSSRSPVIRIAAEAKDSKELETAVSRAEEIVRNP